MPDITSEDILEKLKKSGYKFTGKRKEIVDLFVHNQGESLTAKDVFERIKPAYPNISLDTVYRTLSLLQENHIIEDMEFSDDASKYRLTCHRSHHHHLICLGCGRTSMLDDCPVKWMQESVGDFMVVNHRFELYGYCKACQ